MESAEDVNQLEKIVIGGLWGGCFDDKFQHSHDS